MGRTAGRAVCKGSATPGGATACRTTTAGTATVRRTTSPSAPPPTLIARKTQAPARIPARHARPAPPVNLKPVCAPPRMHHATPSTPARRSAIASTGQTSCAPIPAATAPTSALAPPKAARPANRTPIVPVPQAAGLARAVTRHGTAAARAMTARRICIASIAATAADRPATVRCTPTRSAMGGGATAIRVNSTVTVRAAAPAYPRRPIPVPAPPPCATCPPARAIGTRTTSVQRPRTHAQPRPIRVSSRRPTPASSRPV